MKKIIGGSVTSIIGLIGLSLFFSDFLSLLAGIIPIILILGGCLAIYIKREETNLDEAPAADHPYPADNPEPSPVSQPCETKTEGSPSQQTGPDHSEETEAKPLESNPVEIEPKEPPNQLPVDTGQKLVGNTGSHVFHTIDCKFSTSNKCTAGFNNRDEALQQGYKPCGTCKP